MDTDLQPAPRRRASALALLAAGGLGGIVLGLGGIAAADDAPASSSTGVEQSAVTPGATTVQDSAADDSATDDGAADDTAPAAGDLCDDPGAAAGATAPGAASGTAGV